MDKRFVWFLALFIVLTACATAVPRELPEAETPSDEITSLAAPTTIEVSPASQENVPTPSENSQITESYQTGSEIRSNNRVVTDEEYPVSVLIPFDGIRPIYEPIFVNAQDATYQDDELVMGVAFENEAKAYPVTVLRFREMVNDELAGIPILATW
ncbi:MAG: DUF3179 domain-containing protein [Chloroflexi bacterium]|nr:DUF3179 domain-containing protein [Chloroflexota bacterium]